MKDKKINIFGAPYQIKYVQSITPTNEGEFVYGECDSSRGLIQIATHDREGKLINDRMMKTSLLHELTHAILNEGCYTGPSSDEPMVEWIAKCLYILLEQKVL